MEKVEQILEEIEMSMREECKNIIGMRLDKDCIEVVKEVAHSLANRHSATSIILNGNKILVKNFALFKALCLAGEIKEEEQFTIITSEGKELFDTCFHGIVEEEQTIKAKFTVNFRNKVARMAIEIDE